MRDSACEKIVLIAVLSLVLIAEELVPPWLGRSRGLYHSAPPGGKQDALRLQRRRGSQHKDNAPASASVYSSFACAGGSQTFEGMELMKTHLPQWPAAGDAVARVCVLRDVCWRNGHVEYYEDPTEATPASTRMAAFEQTGLVVAGYLDYFDAQSGRKRDRPTLWAPHVMHERVPTSITYSEYPVSILDKLSFSTNYAHLLVDSLWGGHMASQIFDFDIEKAQLVGLESCGTSSHMLPSSADDCAFNLKKWVPLFYDNPYKMLPNISVTSGQCFSALIVGAGPAFSLKSLHILRGAVMRQVRLYTHTKLGIVPTFLQQHRILVVEKQPGVRQSRYPELCLDVMNVAARLLPPIDVRCISFTKETSAHDEVNEVVSASVFVSEHGGTSYISRLGRPGMTGLYIGEDPPQEMYDAQIFLHDTDILSFYMSSTGSRRNDLPKMLLLALSHASNNLGLPMPSLLMET
jgi:hypothetical protein